VQNEWEVVDGFDPSGNLDHGQPRRRVAALRDVGALHTRLVPGFVVDTRLEAGARIVTFANGMTVREQIVTVDED
jgi:hypothetical protein